MKPKLKILGVHGLGDHRNSAWKDDWEKTIRAVVPGQDAVDLDCRFLTYDDIFADIDLSAMEVARAVWKLGVSGVAGAVGGKRGLVTKLTDKIRWTAGYVVAWVEDEGFKRGTRKLVLDAIAAEQPDFVLAHSLGSLITYNAFSHADAGADPVAAVLARVRYVTLGSQIANPFVIGNLTAGRVEPLPVRHWYHLYNDEDAVFTRPIRVWVNGNFNQIDTHFDVDGMADHDATEYLKHRGTIEGVWRPAVEVRIDARAFGATRPKAKAPSATALRKAGRRTQRALLIGINDYPNEQDRLEGCVNDVFLMSSVLQECGFPPEAIRVCLDDRATAAGIRERLDWLLDDPMPGDERVLYYSGHGAKIPQYGEFVEPDRETETLVPWDFDWTAERAIVDDQIFALYSQLPYETRFAMILDCCHSGGMHRQGGARVRGLNPPDDIRHRELRWDSQSDMWVPRDFRRINEKFSAERDVNAAFFGKRGVAKRIGRAASLRRQTATEYAKEKR